MAYSPPGQTRERVFGFVRRRLLSGQPPSIREVQHAMGFRAVETARSHLTALVDEGRLERVPGKARSLKLPNAPPPPVQVPLLGRVQAGDLSLALESPAGHVAVQTHHRLESLLALTVEGESMVGAGILPGDVVVVRRQPTAENGEIVVAMVDDQATVKRLHLDGDRVELRPENPTFVPIVPAGELHLVGKVIEVRRLLE